MFKTECVNHTQRDDIYEEFVTSVIKEAFVRSDIRHLLKQKTVTLSYAVVSEEEMQKINNTVRGKNTPTDIISIGEYDHSGALESAVGDNLFLGELIVCYDFIEKSAKMDAVHFLHEVAFVVSHGVLHLRGYDHGEEMFALQDDISEKMMRAYNVI